MSNKVCSKSVTHDIKSKSKECIVKDDINLCVEKNLLNVSRRPGGVDSYISLVLIYEIVLFNRGGCKIIDLQINDTFAGLITSSVAHIIVNAFTTDNNLLLDTTSNISSTGNFLKSGSYLNPCSVNRILVKMTIVSNKVVLNNLFNTVAVTGHIQTEIESCYKCDKEINPIVISSPLWSNTNGILIISIL